ncbi:glycosyltransferase [Clostridium sp. UBA871]|uniref:glycosyltransferase n=1 Tax=Clostridium sp. UBA871 TaxID=1946380 RepID=UPI003216BF7B
MNLNEKNDKIISYLINTYIFIFIFTMMNREFLLFSLDSRYLLIALGCYLILYSLFRMIKYKEKIRIDRLSLLLIAFYILCILSNIMWLKGDIKINYSVFANVLLLYSFNLISILVFVIYREKVNVKTVYKSIMVSGMILFISMILIGMGFNLNEIMGGEYSGKIAGSEHKNFFGYNIRLAGYAQDANYASMFMVIWGATIIKYINNKMVKFVFLILAIIGLMISASKTVILGVLVGLVMVVILRIDDKKNKNLYPLIKNTFVILIVSVPYITMKVFEAINYSGSIQTMSTRFKMWGSAINLFKENFLLGHGLTSIRSYFEASPNGWYVQCHSSIFQIMSENGMIALILFAMIIAIVLNYKNKYVVFLVSVFLVFSLTSELIYLSIFVFIVSILPIIGRSNRKKRIIDDKKVLFIVNSLGKGGAERVVVNIANKMATQEYKVTIISLYNKQFYKVDEKINLIILNKNENENTMKKMFSIIINTYKINRIVDQLEQDYKFGLITSHLPLSNIICKLSNFNDKCIHVIHNVYSAIEGNHRIILSVILKILYNNCKVTTVSSGVERELVERYGVKSKFIKTIYNPIDINSIQNLSKEEIEEKDKYILFCGRLTKIKRPDIVIDAFTEGEFYNNYKLIILGDGELREELEQQCEKLKISNRVIFTGWESNVYKYMRNSSLLVSCSEFEALPMNLLEAFCCGARVVSTDCNYGPREILLGKYKKYLVKENNLRELVLTIRDALNDYPDDGVRLVEKFDTINIISEYLNTSLEWINQTKENRYFIYIKE